MASPFSGAAIQRQDLPPRSAPQPRRPLQREGAMILLSPAEQALQDAILRSSPPPEPVLGKLETFLLVSSCPVCESRLSTAQDTAPGRQAKLFITILSLENKVDAFRSAATPYQVSEDLKVSFVLMRTLMDVFNGS